VVSLAGFARDHRQSQRTAHKEVHRGDSDVVGKFGCASLPTGNEFEPGPRVPLENQDTPDLVNDNLDAVQEDTAQRNESVVLSSVMSRKTEGSLETPLQV